MKKILTFMFAASLLVSCQQEENETVTTDNSRITLSPIITRATATSFQDADQIGVTITQSGDFVYAANKLMTYNSGVFSSDLLWYPEGNDESRIVAYYPYNADGVPTSFSVKLDQTTDYGASDLIAASKSDARPSTNAIVMEFKHMLTNLVINVENDTQSEISSVVLKGSIPTATFDLAALKVAVDENVATADITAQKDAENNKLYRAIVIPQTVAFTLAVTTADGKTLSQRLTSTTLVQNGQYSIDVRVLPDDIIVTLKGDIEDWNEQGSIGADNEIPFEEHLDENYFLYDGVKYNTVTLANGTTWMAEPLIYLPKGFTPSTDPTADSHIWYPYEIVDGTTVATTGESAIKGLGYLYDLQAALGGKEITDTNLTDFEGAQGICPKGWHIPTRLEYFNLVGKSNNDADNKVPADGDKALFYDATYDGGKIVSINEAGFNYQFSGVRMATSLTGVGSYQKTAIGSEDNIQASWHGKPAMNYYMTSTAYKPIYNGTSGVLTNIQFFGLMSTINTSKYPEGRLSLSYVSVKAGMQLRCIRD